MPGGVGKSPSEVRRTEGANRRLVVVGDQGKVEQAIAFEEGEVGGGSGHETGSNSGMLGTLCADLYKRSMAQMNVSIPDRLKGWAEQRVAEGRYSSTSDYIRDLVRRDQEHEEKLRRLQAAIDEGRASGTSKRGVDDIIADGRRRRAAAE
jgi:antitoxin ParD1/3/4